MSGTLARFTGQGVVVYGAMLAGIPAPRTLDAPLQA